MFQYLEVDICNIGNNNFGISDLDKINELRKVRCDND